MTTNPRAMEVACAVLDGITEICGRTSGTEAWSLSPGSSSSRRIFPAPSIACGDRIDGLRAAESAEIRGGREGDSSSGYASTVAR